jgi:hypothetical protein
VYGAGVERLGPLREWEWGPGPGLSWWLRLTSPAACRKNDAWTMSVQVSRQQALEADMPNPTGNAPRRIAAGVAATIMSVRFRSGTIMIRCSFGDKIST